MIALSLLFLVEKHSPKALAFGRVLGVALVILGVAVMTQPDLLHKVSGAGTEGAPPMEMR